MKIIITLILSAFILTSCSNPDTSGGVTLQKSPGEPDAVSESDGGTHLNHGAAGPVRLPRENLSLTLPHLRTNSPHGDCWKPHILGDTSKKRVVVIFLGGICTLGRIRITT